jgi:hypothetical protein
MMKSPRPSRVIAVSALLIMSSVVGIRQPALAQNPYPTLYMYDSAPGNPYPPTAPFEGGGAAAIVVEGLGSNSCAYSLANIEYYSWLWSYYGYRTVTEITPQTYCGTLSQFENTLSQITSYVEKYGGPNIGYYWAGFMLDEEPGYYFTASQLEALNTYTYNLMAGTPGMSWYFTENQPNGWDLGTYNAIIAGSWAAPQVYSNSMLNSVNSECSTYGMCTNLVTINSTYSYPLGDSAYVCYFVTGYPWSNGFWLPGYYWHNDWRPQ